MLPPADLQDVDDSLAVWRRRSVKTKQGEASAYTLGLGEDVRGQVERVSAVVNGHRDGQCITLEGHDDQS